MGKRGTGKYTLTTFLITRSTHAVESVRLQQIILDKDRSNYHTLVRFDFG